MIYIEKQIDIQAAFLPFGASSVGDIQFHRILETVKNKIAETR